MANLCIIPARGGSKRIPKKNIRAFYGRPIISYSIEVASNSGLFSEIMVSTDSEEIKYISEKYGAKVPFMRSVKSSDDFATTFDVVVEVLEKYLQLGYRYDNVCVVYPTAPLVQAHHLVKGLRILKDYSAVMPVTEFSYPVFRSLTLNSGVVEYRWPEYRMSRSQEIERLFHDAGQWYWIKTDRIIDSLLPERTFGLVLDPREVQDIDTLEDWELAELKYKLLYLDKI